MPSSLLGAAFGPRFFYLLVPPSGYPREDLVIFDVDIKFRDILLLMGADPITKPSRVGPNFIEEAYLAL